MHCGLLMPICLPNRNGDDDDGDDGQENTLINSHILKTNVSLVQCLLLSRQSWESWRVHSLSSAFLEKQALN